MKRRSVLALCGTALLSLAGCLFEASDATPGRQAMGTPTATPSPSPTPTQTPAHTPTPLPDRTVSFPDGPKAPPTRPADLTLRTAIGYVREFHYRATYNTLWPEGGDGPKLSCQVVRAAQRGSVFRVVARCDTSLNVETATDASDAGLSLGRDYVYYLDGDSLIRKPLSRG